MDYQSIARPIRRWAMKHRDEPIKLGEKEFYLRKDEMGSLIEKEGGMGVAYRCYFFENDSKHNCWIKHARINDATEKQLRTNLTSRNNEIIEEARVQANVHSHGFATEVVYTGNFAVSTDLSMGLEKQ